MDATLLRRIQLELMTPAEKAIYDASLEVEKVGADERLTKAVVLLSEARNLVADYVDEQIHERLYKENVSAPASN
jgi:hypothetical protein